MRRVLCILVPAVSLAAAAAGPLEIIDDFESGELRWFFSEGAEFPGAAGALERSTGAARSGGHGARLHFDFRGGGAYVGMYHTFRTPVVLPGFRFAIRTPVEATVTVRVTDSTGQTVQKSCRTARAQWQIVSVGMNGWTGHWGGANDGRVHQPVRGIGILVERAGMALQTGFVCVDDVLMESGAGSSSDAAITEYQVADLQAAPLPPSTTLLGDPLALQVLLESGGSDGSLRIVCASHFQAFEKTVALPGGEGRHVVEVAVPPTGWHYRGGQNDGRLHGPIRLTGLDVRGAARGRVALLEVRCRTRIVPSQAVATFPAVEVDGDRARFDVTLKNTTGAPVPVDVRFDVSTWDGAALLDGSFTLEVPAGGAVRPPLARAIMPGGDAARHREADRRDTGTGWLSLGPQTFALGRGWVRPRGTAGWQEASIGAARGATIPGDARRASRSLWGVGLYLYRYPASTDGFRLMAQAAALARDAGVKWSREEFQWHRIEPRPGEFEWSYYDRMVETALDHGIQIYGLLAYWSSWAQAYTPEGIEAYARWAAAVVRRYRDRIRHWEVWNEPNIFFWRGPRDMYADLLKKAYAAIKDVDPAAQVLGLSTAGIDTPFIARMLDLDAPFDALTIHPYRKHLDETSFMRELREVRALVGGRPVWITEMGWPTQIGSVDEAEQARLLARCYLSAAASGAVENVSWYNFRDDGEDPLYNEHRFGVVRRNLQPKAAYLALATVCRTLAGAPYLKPLPGEDAAEGFFACSFGGESGWAAVVWTARAPRIVRLRTGAVRVTVRNLVGEDRETPVAGGGVDLALVPGQPVFVMGAQPFSACRTLGVIDAAGAILEGEELPVAWQVKTALDAPFEIIDDWSGTTHRLGAEPGSGRFTVAPPAGRVPGVLRLRIRRGTWEGLLPVRVEIVPDNIRL